MVVRSARIISKKAFICIRKNITSIWIHWVRKWQEAVNLAWWQCKVQYSITDMYSHVNAIWHTSSKAYMHGYMFEYEDSFNNDCRKQYTTVHQGYEALHRKKYVGDNYWFTSTVMATNTNLPSICEILWPSVTPITHQVKTVYKCVPLNGLSK